MFIVNSTADTADAIPGDGIADTDLLTPGLQTTLRAAMQEAIASPNPITIDLTQVSGTITLTSLLPIIDRDIHFQGSDANTLIISGNNQFQLFFIEAGTVTFSDITLANGRAQGGNGGAGKSGGGGAAGLGGALLIRGGSVTVDDVLFLNNQAIGGNGGTPSSLSGGGGGGGIGNPGFDAASSGIGGNGGDGGNLKGIGGLAGIGGNTQTSGSPGGAGGEGAGGGGGSFGNTAGSFGGNGGFGAGGGGGGASNFSSFGHGGAGGFGGGGGGAGNLSAPGGAGGSFGGQGGSGYVGNGGGGGAGLGGAIFIEEGTLILVDTRFEGNIASGGPGSGNGSAGQGKGGAIFAGDQASVFTIPATLDFVGNSASHQTNQSSDNENLFGSVATLPLTVGLSVSNPTLTESTLNSSVFTVERSHGFGEVTLQINITGNARPNDYTLSGTLFSVTGSIITLTIPDGQTSAAITLTPREDNRREGDESIILTLASSDDYSLGTPSSAAATILANEPLVVDSLLNPMQRSNPEASSTPPDFRNFFETSHAAALPSQLSSSQPSTIHPLFGAEPDIGAANAQPLASPAPWFHQ